MFEQSIKVHLKITICKAFASSWITFKIKYWPLFFIWASFASNQAKFRKWLMILEEEFRMPLFFIQKGEKKKITTNKQTKKTIQLFILFWSGFSKLVYKQIRNGFVTCIWSKWATRKEERGQVFIFFQNTFSYPFVSIPLLDWALERRLIPFSCQSVSPQKTADSTFWLNMWKHDFTTLFKRLQDQKQWYR